MTYTDITTIMTTIKKGFSPTKVTGKLGSPDTSQKNYWIYNFTKYPDFPKLPPPKDNCVYLGLILVFQNEKVNQIKFCKFNDIN